MTDIKEQFQKMNEDERIVFFLDYIKSHQDCSENKMADEVLRKQLPAEPVASMLYYAAKHNHPKYLYTILDNIPQDRMPTALDNSTKVYIAQFFLEYNHIEQFNKFLEEHCIVDEKIDTLFINKFY